MSEKLNLEYLKSMTDLDDVRLESVAFWITDYLISQEFSDAVIDSGMRFMPQFVSDKQLKEAFNEMLCQWHRETFGNDA